MDERSVIHHLTYYISEDDVDIYFPIDLEQTNTPMVIVAALDKNSEHITGTCEVATVNKSASPAFGMAAQHYLIKTGKDPMEVDISKVSINVIRIVRQPEHGYLVMNEEDPYGGGKYFPDNGYLGKDRAEAIVSVGNDIVKVVYYFVVQQAATDQLSTSEWDNLCPKELQWIISQPTPEDNNTPASWYRATSLYALLTGAAFHRDVRRGLFPANWASDIVDIPAGERDA